jgi:hypothetical protein
MKESVMAIDHSAGASVNGRLLYGPSLRITFILFIALVVVAGEAIADTWTGAGQSPINQIRNWQLGSNWTLGSPPAPNASNTFTPSGEGAIQLNGIQSAGSMVFNQFTYTTIDPGPPVASYLDMVLPTDHATSYTLSNSKLRI